MESLTLIQARWNEFSDKSKAWKSPYRVGEFRNIPLAFYRRTQLKKA